MLKNGWINIRLKRKIARAEKALGNVTVTNE